MANSRGINFVVVAVFMALLIVTPAVSVAAKETSYADSRKLLSTQTASDESNKHPIPTNEYSRGCNAINRCRGDD
ncbi:unnamed protein product [Cuscuta epithymum]|uniref:Uncharacterized protein n=1 Tax=Cuscuta epithymum TaxID=186058 RepID=A0AAV0D0V6_9ASTE|nr:unnamed protein product [Cuscuta epithymum]